MNAIKSYPDFCGYGFVLFNRRMRFKELKVIPTFFVRKPVFISFLSKGRDNRLAQAPENGRKTVSYFAKTELTFNLKRSMINKNE